MLTHLHIQNYALIGNIDIDFQAGFSALTGETGAGKSIILGALALVMGGRADTQSITEGEERCVIEADFGDYLIRRELNRNGRSRSFVNDEVVTQTELKALANQLIDIHSQHENLLIENDDFQLSIVDAIAHNETYRTAYSEAYATYTTAQQALKDLQNVANKSRQDADYLTFQFQQLEEAHLVAGELDELEQEQYRLNHAEDIKQQLQLVLEKLDNDDQGASTLIHSCHVDDIDATLDQRLRSVDIELQDIVSDLTRLYDNVEFNPERLQLVEERLDLINTLLRKHQLQTVEELIQLHDDLDVQLQQIANFDDELARLKSEIDAATKVLQKASEQLTKSRHAVLEGISSQLIKDLSCLGIMHANIAVSIEPLPDFTPNGKDNVQFLFAANLNQSLRRVSEVASGGEIARLMLCIKALIASSNGLPTIIFDEIDTGVSGEVATQMGRIMQQMASSRQIIAITHLPQIAAQATTQYKVYKQDTDRRTETNITLLSDAQRIDEIASMLAGKNITDSVRATAQQMLKS
ncbi:MAG: DNA repair protein RecN [Paludibacteraceae bacterium]|nr:DNA repair protein RecN [Paludibacteraceae bacterium]